MNQVPPPSLGAAVNLLQGAAGLALAVPPQQALQHFAVDVAPGAPGPWAPPRVTLHEGTASLAARLFPHCVVPFRFDGPRFSIEPMLLREPQDAPRLAQHIEALLRVRADAGACYLLFERRRRDVRAGHEAAGPPARREFDRERHLTAQWRVAGSRLRPGRHVHDGSEQDAVIPAQLAHAYVDCFYDYGTHFVSAVEVGDTLFQAIVLRPDSVHAVRAYWLAAGSGAPVEGDAALSFHAFAGPAYAVHAGPVVSLAGDPAVCGLAAGGDATLRLLSGAPPCGAGQVAARTAIGVELSSLGRFMEFHRGRNFERVLRGALLQRWGQRAATTLRRLPGAARALSAQVLEGEADRLAALPTAGVRCTRVLDLRQAGRHLAGDGLVLAQFVDAAPCTADAPTVCLPDDGFAQPGLACATMCGALLLENASGSACDAVVDGLRFTSDPDGAGQPRVRIRGAFGAQPLPAPQAGPALPAAIQLALQRSACALAFADADDPWRRAAAASFAGWLGEVLAATQDAAPALRAWAACLSRLEPSLAGLPPWTEPARSVLAALGTAAVRAGEQLRGLAGRPAQDSAPTAAAACDALGALDRSISHRYLALLEHGRAPARDLLEQAAVRRDLAAGALRRAGAVLQVLPSVQQAPAACRVLRLLAAAVAQEPPPPVPPDAGPALLGLAALELAAHDGHRQLDALDKALAALAAEPLQFQAAADAFGAIGLDAACPEGAVDWPGMHTAMPGLCGKGRDALDALRMAWEELFAARRALLAARASHARLLLERWQQAHLIPALRHPAPGVAADGVEPTRLSMLTTLGRAARALPSQAQQPRMPGGAPEPDIVGLVLTHLPPFGRT